MDDGIPIGMILLFILCLGGSAFFSATETALSSVSRIRMRSLAEDGNPRAKRVLSILDNFDDALAAILIGNNVVNIGCATIATIIATKTWGLGAVTVATLLTTVLVFMLGETLPKTIAKAGSESVALRVAGAVSFLMRALRPLTAFFARISALASKPFRGLPPAPTVTDAELREMIDGAVEVGALNEETGVLVQSAIRYGQLNVRDILTPWKQVRKLPLHTPADEALAIVKASSHSRLPVIDATGSPVGILRTQNYLKATLRSGAPASLEAAMDAPHSISDTTPVDALLPMMSGQRVHFMFVRDEWENVLGIVTVEDIVERLVGDIWDEEDEVILAQGGGAPC